MNFDFLKIGNETARVQDELQQLRKGSQSNRQLREEMKELPIPRDDFAEQLCEKVDSLAELGRVDLRKFYEPNRMGYQEHVFTIFGAAEGGVDFRKVNENVLCLLFGDVIKANLRKELATWQWPEKVGPARAKRNTALEQLDKEIVSMESKYAEMRSQAEAAGIAVERISAPVGKKGIT